MPDPSLAVAYIRVSTGEQAIGPDAQLHAIEAWCERYGVELACDPFYDHGVSGALDFDKRPALLDAMDALGIYDAQILLAHKRDRIARDRALIGHLELLLRRKECRICTTDHSPAVEEHLSPVTKAMEGLQDIFAELERAMIKARTKAALAAKRRKGQRIGTVPYGHDLAADKIHLKRSSSEQRTITLIKKLRSQGLSLRAIGAKLTSCGIKPRSGGKWYASSIKNIAEFEPPTKDGDDVD